MMNDMYTCNVLKDLKKIQICFKKKRNTHYINKIEFEYINAPRAK